MMFLDCPAWLDEEGAVRCGLPAEVRCRFTLRSADGPLEGAMIRCPDGHWFNGAIESLTSGPNGAPAYYLGGPPAYGSPPCAGAARCLLVADGSRPA